MGDLLKAYGFKPMRIKKIIRKTLRSEVFHLRVEDVNACNRTLEMVGSKFDKERLDKGDALLHYRPTFSTSTILLKTLHNIWSFSSRTRRPNMHVKNIIILLTALALV